MPDLAVACPGRDPRGFGVPSRCAPCRWTEPRVATRINRAADAATPRPSRRLRFRGAIRRLRFTGIFEAYMICPRVDAGCRCETVETEPMRRLAQPKSLLPLGRNLLFVTALAATPFASALADEIYGRIWSNWSKEPLADAEVYSDDCDVPRDKAVTTDRYGYYRLDVGKRRGQYCDVAVFYDDQNSAELEVYVKSRRTLADIEVRSGADEWRLIRR